MSPLTAKLKCPHGDRKHTHGAEAVTEVACNRFGGVGKITLSKKGGDEVGDAGSGGEIPSSCSLALL
jgi:hypothetical protein